MYLPVSMRPKARWCFLLIALLPFPSDGGTGTTTQTLSATINPGYALTTPATAALTHGQNYFQPFQTTFAVNYEVRTSPSGSGKITLQVTNDFAPSGGPSAASGVLTYTCGAANLGTPCSGTQTASTTAQTPLLTLPASACTGGGGACSNQDPNSVNLTFILTDDPGYSTGNYSATVTFTISAT
jgi:hypothetical protein